MTRFDQSSYDWHESPLSIALDKMKLGEPVTRFNDSNDRAYLIHDPELIKQVFIREARYYVEEKHPYLNFKHFAHTPGLEALKIKHDGDRAEMMASMQAKAKKYCVKAVDEWASRKGLIDVYPLISRYIIELIGELYFAADVSDIAEELFDGACTAEQAMALERRAILTETQKEEVTDMRMRGHGAMKGALKEMLLRGLQKKNMNLSELMADERLTHPLPNILTRTFLNSYAGVATTLSWGVLLLSEHSTYQSQLASRIRAADVDAEEHLQAFINESLRLYPTAWMMTRTATEDRSLAGVDFAKGTDLHVCLYSLHRDPRFWSEVDRFDPGRFVANTKKENFNPLAFLPFGLGEHRCVGSKFATEIMLSFYRELLNRFEISGPGLGKVEAFPFVALRPTPSASAQIIAASA